MQYFWHEVDFGCLMCLRWGGFKDAPFTATDKQAEHTETTKTEKIQLLHPLSNNLCLFPIRVARAYPTKHPTKVTNPSQGAYTSN